MQRPNFTREQEDYICWQIGEWYLKWKHVITDLGVEHKLGYAKEQLKRMICDPDPIKMALSDLMVEIMEEQNGTD